MSEVILKELIKTEEDTISFANKMKDYFNEGETVILNGDLGTGKTFFVKQFAKNFNIDNVNSPTFAIVNVYEGDGLKINHFDFYRIKYVQELFDIGFNDYLSDKDALTFIEWGEMFPEILPSSRYEIDIKVTENLDREIKVKKYVS